MSRHCAVLQQETRLISSYTLLHDLSGLGNMTLELRTAKSTRQTEVQLSQVPKKNNFFLVSKVLQCGRNSENRITTSSPQNFFKFLNTHARLWYATETCATRTFHYSLYDAYIQSSQVGPINARQIKYKQKNLPYREICTSKNTQQVTRTI